MNFRFFEETGTDFVWGHGRYKGKLFSRRFATQTPKIYNDTILLNLLQNCPKYTLANFGIKACKKKKKKKKTTSETGKHFRTFYYGTSVDARYLDFDYFE